VHTLSSLTKSSFPSQHAVASSASETLSWGQLMADVAATRLLISARDNSGWALFEEDGYLFCVGLLALLAENKSVYIPGENHAGIVEALFEEGVQFMGLFPAAPVVMDITGGSCGTAHPLEIRGEIIVFTSGSTGRAKAIPKRLSQIDAELLALESMWGERLSGARILRMVSHQHLYGLLFAILWPLCAGRCFWRRAFVDPVALARQAATMSRSAWVMSPAQLHRLGSDMLWAEVRPSLATVFSSGGPLQRASAREIFEKAGDYPLEIFGSSETGAIAWRQQIIEPASWRPLPDVEVDFTTDSALAVRSPFLQSSGWEVTSDAATAAADGGFLLGDRLDRIIKIEGKRVALPQVELCLRQHGVIADAVAVVLQRQRQCVGAVLVLSAQGQKQYEQTGHANFVRNLRTKLGLRLAATAVPKVFRIVKELPRNSQGKLLYNEIMRLFDSGLLPRILQREVGADYCRLQLAVPHKSPYFDAHFPGAPILPGVVQLKWAEHFARELLGLNGPFLGMQKVKFQNLVRPGMELELQLQYSAGSGRLEFSFRSDGGQHSQGRMNYGIAP
jgi:3-hydroxymyristoyl/3-hydroxydecanoyl-(acyl carrier protein) dehydratase